MKKSQYDWGIIAFIVGYHLALLIGLPFYFMHYSPSWGVYAATGALVYISGMAVTAGYHRYYSHSTYKTRRPVEAVLLFFATMATQGSALKWAHDHRRHHAFVDTDRDPYSIKKGFWYAHILWMFHKSEPIDRKIVAELCRNPLVMFQHRHYALLMIVTNLIAVGIMGWVFNDLLTSFVFIWGVRLFLLHHFTWFINSLAHTWGAKPFGQEHSAVDCYAMSLVTFGEGYHNYHHTFANDYRNGIRWYHFDPTKWLIWLLSKCGLASGLRRVSQEQIRERMVIERKNELILLVKNYLSQNSALLEEKIEKKSLELLEKWSDFSKVTREYRLGKKEGTSNRDRLRELQLRIKTLRKAVDQEWNSWKKFSKQVQEMASTSSDKLSSSSGQLSSM